MTLSKQEKLDQLFEQSKEAAHTPFKKSGLDSLSQWEFEGLETLAMRDTAVNGFNIQKDFENAQAMSKSDDMEIGR